MMSRSVALGCLALAGAALPRTAAAETQWYGWQPMLTDAASLSLGAIVLSDLAGKASGAALGASSVVLYLAGGPVVHLAHANYGRAVTSLGVRAGMPLLGFAIGRLFGDEERPLSQLATGILGGGIGVLGAIAIDYAGLAYDPVEGGPPQLAFSIGGRFR